MKSSQIVPPSQQIIQSIVNDYLPYPSPRGVSISKEARQQQSASIRGVAGTDILHSQKQPVRSSPIYGEQMYSTFHNSKKLNDDNDGYEDQVYRVNGNAQQQHRQINNNSSINRRPQTSTLSSKQQQQYQSTSTHPRYVDSPAFFPQLNGGGGYDGEYRPYSDFKQNEKKDSKRMLNGSATFTKHKNHELVKMTEQQAQMIDSQQQFPRQEQIFQNGFDSIRIRGKKEKSYVQNGNTMTMRDLIQEEEQDNIDKEIDKLLMQEQEFKQSMRCITGNDDGSQIDQQIFSDQGTRNLDKISIQRQDILNDEELKQNSTYDRRNEAASYSKKHTMTDNTNIDITQNRTGYDDEDDFFSQKSIGQKSSNITGLHREDEKMEDYLKRSTLFHQQEKQ